MSGKLVVPRVICDHCMKDARVLIVGDQDQPHSCEVVIECHDTAELIDWNSLGHEWVQVHVWSNIAHKFFNPSMLGDRESIAVEAIIRNVDKALHYYSVRRAQGAAPTFHERAVIDRAVDTLLLFRPEPDQLPPEPPAPPAPPEPPPNRPIGAVDKNGTFRCNKCQVTHRRGPADGQTKYECRHCKLAGTADPVPVGMVFP